MIRYFIFLISAVVVLGALFVFYHLKRPQRPYLLRLLIVGTAVMFSYLIMEAAVTVYWRITWKNTSISIFEDKDVLHFDAVRGYRLPVAPSRWARITNGAVEFVGVLHGNAQGFPSRMDFCTKRPSNISKRFAVFGDSFTAGQFLAESWPDHAQSLLQDRGCPVQFLNFSVDGGGLANWWSVLTRFVGPENYQIDGVIFAVFEGDLARKFSISENQGARRHRFGRWFSWDPVTYPSTLEEATPYLRDTKAYIVSTRDFDEFLQKRWPASVPRHPWRPVLASTLLQILRDSQGRANPPIMPPDLVPGQISLIEDIHTFLEARRLPAVVVTIPTRKSLLSPDAESAAWLKTAQAFASDIGASFVDGSAAFEHLADGEKRKSYLPYDPHWSQAGSDRFAIFMAKHLPSSCATTSLP